MRLRCIAAGGCPWLDIPGPYDMRDESGNAWLPRTGQFRDPRLIVFQRCPYCGSYRSMVISPNDHESRYSRPRQYTHEVDEDLIKQMIAGGD